MIEKGRFSDFEFDCSSGELRKCGQRIPIANQTFNVLLCLIQTPGVLVTHEQIRKKLWRDQTFGDFEHGLHKAVSKLRFALGDSADSPRYIETVPRRGYRFIADVETVSATQPHQPPSPLPKMHPSHFPNPVPAHPSSTQILPKASTSTNSRHSLKSLAFTLLFFGAAFLISPTPHHQAATDPPSHDIAVLPFTSHGNNGIALGLTQEIIEDLAHVPGIRVKALSVVQHHNYSQQPASTLGRLLGVDELVYGNIVTEDNVSRLHVELVDAEHNSHVWSGVFELSRAALPTVKSKVRNGIFLALYPHTSLTKVDGTSKMTSDPEAYWFYLRGLQAFALRTDPGMHECVSDLSEATGHDPHFVAAWSMLGMCYMIMPVYTDIRADDVLGKADDAAHKALALDPQNPNAHAVLGWIQSYFSYRPDLGAGELKLAVIEKPDDPYLRYLHALCLKELGSIDEADKELQVAQTIDPYSPLIRVAQVHSLMYKHQQQKAAQMAEDLLSVYDDYAKLHETLGWIYWHLHKYEEATAQWDIMNQMNGRNMWAEFERRGPQIIAAKGVNTYLDEKIGLYLAQGNDARFAAEIGELYMIKGDSGKALFWFNLGRRDRSPLMGQIFSTIVGNRLEAQAPYKQFLETFPSYAVFKANHQRVQLQSN